MAGGDKSSAKQKKQNKMAREFSHVSGCCSPFKKEKKVVGGIIDSSPPFDCRVVGANNNWPYTHTHCDFSNIIWGIIFSVCLRNNNLRQQRGKLQSISLSFDDDDRRSFFDFTT